MEEARDAVLKKPAPADEAERMIRSLVDMRAIGPEFATLLVREAFVREFRNRRALGGYVGLGGTPFSKRRRPSDSRFRSLGVFERRPCLGGQQWSMKGRHPKTSYEGREVNCQIPVAVNSDS